MSIKPHNWNSKKDAKCCIECMEPFKRGDKVFTDIAFTFHAKCLDAYRKSLERLGLSQ